ncbi:MAG: 50S ribosomal protein L3 [Leptospiraceae bacterium]|nr:50S ribosomal protein L3 [Leptospiraceae bacterium]MCB1321811.1 50S ribosomal protein L3 [Leptospiraceae bacterium]
MARGIIARKLGMTRVFDDDGNNIPVTVLQAGPCRVMQVKTQAGEQYDAVQIGFEPVRANLLSKAEQGHQKGVERPYRILREFRDAGDYEVGSEIKADVFAEGDIVKITGISKGKGFQGAMKRHGFGGGRATHGSGFHRAPGSLNASAYPSRVFKGKKLPGHMGVRVTTIANVKVVRVDVDNDLLLIKGAVPGPRTGYVTIEAM